MSETGESGSAEFSESSLPPADARSSASAAAAAFKCGGGAADAFADARSAGRARLCSRAWRACTAAAKRRRRSLCVSSFLLSSAFRSSSFFCNSLSFCAASFSLCATFGSYTRTSSHATSCPRGLRTFSATGVPSALIRPFPLIVTRVGTSQAPPVGEMVSSDELPASAFGEIATIEAIRSTCDLEPGRSSDWKEPVNESTNSMLGAREQAATRTFIVSGLSCLLRRSKKWPIAVALPLRMRMAPAPSNPSAVELSVPEELMIATVSLTLIGMDPALITISEGTTWMVALMEKGVLAQKSSESRTPAQLGHGL
mmetsp:Transcript_32467/g.80767  ORF Transcript_32467/g.80767 Transcript_32467/m.80767 type:complete len:313 (-) Transcript_32467:376-1314(-)